MTVVVTVTVTVTVPSGSAVATAGTPTIDTPPAATEAARNVRREDLDCSGF